MPCPLPVVAGGALGLEVGQVVRAPLAVRDLVAECEDADAHFLIHAAGFLAGRQVGCRADDCCLAVVALGYLCGTPAAVLAGVVVALKDGQAEPCPHGTFGLRPVPAARFRGSRGACHQNGASEWSWHGGLAWMASNPSSGYVIASACTNLNG